MAPPCLIQDKETENKTGELLQFKEDGDLSSFCRDSRVAMVGAFCKIRLRIKDRKD